MPPEKNTLPSALGLDSSSMILETSLASTFLAKSFAPTSFSSTSLASFPQSLTLDCTAGSLTVASAAVKSRKTMPLNTLSKPRISSNLRAATASSSSCFCCRCCLSSSARTKP